ncbi:MAG: ABC transporter substrate-binding protein [Alphaproteobacteria bacterium]
MRRLVWAAAVLAAVAGRAALAADPVVLGAVLSETPAAAGVSARLIRAGMEAAIAVANAEEAGRRQPLRLLVRDDGGVLARSGEAVERSVREDKAVAVLGGQTSATAIAQIGAGARAGRPIVNVNGWERGLRLAGVADVFHVAPDEDTVPDAIARSIVAVRADRVAIVLGAGERAAADRAAAIRAAVGSLRSEVALRTATIDLTHRGPYPAVASFLREPADVVLAIAGGATAARLVAPVRAAGVAPSLTTLLMDGGGITDALPTRDDLAGPTRLMLAVALHHPDLPVTPRGAAARRQLADEIPETRLFHQGADAVFAVVDALRRARGTDAAALVRALEAGTAEGTRGPVAFAAEPGPRHRQRRDVPFALVQHVEPGEVPKLVWRPGAAFEAGAIVRSARPAGAKR